MRSLVIFTAVAASIMVGCDGDAPSIEPADLPACFAVDVGEWTVTPADEYEFTPVRVVLSSEERYSDFAQEVVGRVAFVVEDEGQMGAWAWRASEERAELEVFQDPPGFGGRLLTLSRRGQPETSGRVEWFSDAGTGGTAPLTVREEQCSSADRRVLELAASRAAAP